MSDQIVSQLTAILQKKFPDSDFSALSLDSDIKALGIDSLDFIEFIYEIETTFTIEIPSESLGNITTIQDVITLIQTCRTLA